MMGTSKGPDKIDLAIAAAQQKEQLEQIPVRLGSTGRTAVFILPVDLTDSEAIDVGIGAMLAVRSLVERRGKPRLIIQNGHLPEPRANG